MLRLLLTIFALCFALPAHAQANDANGNAQNHAVQTRPSQSPEPMLPPAIQDAIRRIPVALEAANAQKNIAKQEERAERDVRAQEDIAGWASWMFGLGAAEISLTAIGVILLFFTLKETRATAKDTAAQAKLARQTYIASNRPRLRVRHLRVAPLVEREPITVQYEVINVGDTRARIVSNEITVRVPLVSNERQDKRSEAIATRQFAFGNEVQQGEAIIAKGEITTYDPAWGYKLPSWDNWWNGRLFVIGMIKYMDDNGVTRRTAFYRVATPDLNRFKTGINVEAQFDYEYED